MRPTIDLLTAALYGNLILSVIHKQIGMFVPVYLFGSLALNVMLLLLLKRVIILPRLYQLFLAFSIICVISGIIAISVHDSVTVFVRYIWFLSSIFVCYNLLKQSNGEQFETLRRFFVHFS